MCPRPEQQIVDACVRAANAEHEAEEYALEGKHLEESRRILVAMKYERALAIFDRVTGPPEVERAPAGYDLAWDCPPQMRER